MTAKTEEYWERVIRRAEWKAESARASLAFERAMHAAPSGPRNSIRQAMRSEGLQDQWWDPDKIAEFVLTRTDEQLVAHKNCGPRTAEVMRAWAEAWRAGAR